MRKLIFLIAFVFGWLLSQAQEINGTWKGTVDLNGRKLEIAFNISQDGSVYSSTMDCLTQKVYDMSTTSTSFIDSMVTIKLDHAGMAFSGKLANDYTLSGTFYQSGKSYPLELINKKLMRKAKKG
jgi:hypothetical protein